jgi:hypothetical protein
VSQVNVPGGPWRFWIECKATGGRCSADQLAWHAQERAAGGVVLVVDSVQAMVHLMRQDVGWEKDVLGYRMPMGRQLEAEVQKACKALLRAWQFKVSDTSQGYRPGGKRHGTTRITKGVPDLYVTRPAKGAP